ncbi:hypothetical protein BRARA_B02891 [Brassica rapa]|uniref:DUF4283 domain-containing protein n=1 Tax=Brassica campestris TaxID=3711 RepID=A0A398AEE6_BRACM|nr:hypothetical protein BRARA_B02891 [Brassica rapa]
MGIFEGDLVFGIFRGPKGIEEIRVMMGQLVGKGGDKVNGEKARKRLKISVPHFDNSDLIKSYAMTLVGRCMNPEAQMVDVLLVMLPKFWTVEERVTGDDLRMEKFQFHFEREEDIEAVLEMQPYHFDYWILTLARWQPQMPRNFPSEIPFWIKVEGVPLELWSTDTFQSIGDAIGKTTDVDLDFGKMRVVLDSEKELCFETEVDFKGGEFYEEEEALVLLKYDKLFGFCKLCFKLCHDEDHCPMNPRSPSKKKEPKEIEERKEERARSYKGVVINGDVGKQEASKDQREYYGKGKGKMYEEPESKWVKVPERGSKRPSSYRVNTRGEEERSKPRKFRYPIQEDRSMYQRGARREREGPKEEGEISVTERRHRNVHKVENNGVKTAPVEARVTAMELEGETGDRAEIENLVTGLEQAMDLVGVGKEVADSDPLKFDETMILAEHEGTLLGGDDDFQALTDGEVEETDKLDKIMQDGAGGEEELGETGEQDNQVGEEEKKKGPRKVLFKKPSGITVGTSKMRLVQAVLSPRKTGASKSTKRQGGGEGAKHQEEKGSSHPKNSKKPDV